ncbi:MAG: terpene cyclase/mutase family protein, partial [Oscillospiraceae bacterium]|nr:terpene cyclase/mutase family protein [Oscillospiraceae bacterium]
MRTDRLIVCIAALLYAVFFLPVRTFAADKISDVVGGIVAYEMKRNDADDMQEWADALAKSAGEGAEWYAMVLSHEGCDLTGYGAALEKHITENPTRSISTRQKYSLALLAAGTDNDYVRETASLPTDDMSLMNYIYGLHLMHSLGGYEDRCAVFAEHILTQQHEDGGWSVIGDKGDIDVTAMVISSLAPMYEDSTDISASVERGVAFLSEHQLESGGFMSMGAENPESSAQVIMALTALKTDFMSDERFIKNGSTIIDAVMKFRTEDGAFSHKEGTSADRTATVQMFYALSYYLDSECGNYYFFDLKRTAPPPAETSAETSAETAPGTSETTVTSAPATQTEEYTETTVGDLSLTGSTESRRPELKTLLLIAVAAAGGIVCLVLVLTRRRSIKNFIAVGTVTAAAAVIILVSDIHFADEYYSGLPEKGDIVGTVTLSIDCRTVAGLTDTEYIPADGMILPPTQFDIDSDDTVYDILVEAARKYGIHAENTGSSGNAHGMVY